MNTTDSPIEIIEGQFWERRSTKYRVKVMATKDKYAMVRIKGAMPYAVSFHDLRNNYDPIPIQIKKIKELK